MLTLTARQIVLPDELVADGQVTIDDSGTIVEVGPARSTPTLHTVCPGFVDLQVNGIDDVDVASADGADWERLDTLLAAQGVTSWCPTLITDELDAYAAPLARIAAHAGETGARPQILGAHLEGPFLGDRPGAHPRRLIRPVDAPWLESLPEHVRIVTGAPEADPGGHLWAWARRRGVVASIGHSGASAADARDAADSGATMVTHLFNAMSGLDHRDPGVAAAALIADDLVAGLIADGVHVHPDLIRLAYRAKGARGIALVTDAVAWRRGEAGRVRLAFDGTAPRLADGTLAGSALTMDRAVANVQAWDAADLVGAVHSATATPARLVGREDIGVIRPGARADLVELDGDGSCRATWVRGVQIH